MSESRIKIKDVNYSLLESYKQGLEKNHTEAVISRNSVKKLYKEYLGMAGGMKAHKLLHTHYIDRSDV